MPMLRFRVSSGLLIAVGLAAKKSRLLRSEWIREVLDVASGIGVFSTDFVQTVKLKVDGSSYRDESFAVRISENQAKAYQRAADAAFLPCSGWVSVILAATVGVSRLNEQVERVLVYKKVYKKQERLKQTA